MIKKIRRRASVVVIHNDCILGFHAEDPHSLVRYFFIPGGMIEEGESPQQAAVRETFEETGYQIEIVQAQSIERHYDFEWDGQIYDCHTTFLKGRLLSQHPSVVNDAAYHRGVAWASLDKANELFAYHSDILGPVQILSQSSAK